MKTVITFMLFFAFSNIFAQGTLKSKIIISDSVVFEFTTVTDNQQYSPNHVFAVWITEKTGAFVKTLKKMGNDHFLPKWTVSSSSNTVDAITGATLQSHGAHQITWNCKDVDGNTVADGDYKVNIEYASNINAGPYTSIDFEKGDTVTSTPVDKTHYIDIKIKYDVEFEEEVVSIIEKDEAYLRIFPNPAHNNLQIAVGDEYFDDIKILNITGKIVKQIPSTQQVLDIDISNLDNGIYFIAAESQKGRVIRKFVKN